MSRSLFVLVLMLVLVTSVKYECYTRYYYHKTCFRFTFKDDCQKWSLKSCKPTKITRNDPKCPRYFCDPVTEEWTTSTAVTSAIALSFPALPSSSTTTPSRPSTSTRSATLTTTVPRSLPVATSSTRARTSLTSTRSTTTRSTTKTTSLTPSTSLSLPVPVVTSQAPLPVPVPVVTSRAPEAALPPLLPSWTLTSEVVAKSTPPLTTRPSDFLAKTSTLVSSGTTSPEFSLTTASVTTPKLLKIKERFAKASTSTYKLTASSPRSFSRSEPTAPASTASQVPSFVTSVSSPSPAPDPLDRDFVTSSELSKQKKALKSEEKSVNLDSNPTTIDSNRSTLSFSLEEPAGTLSSKESKPSSPDSFDAIPTKLFKGHLQQEVVPTPSSVFETTFRSSLTDYFKKFIEGNLPIMTSEKDCGDRLCSLDYRFVANCVIYIAKNPEEPCDFPCSLENCQSELHHFIACPIWSCADKTTTTASPSDMSTLSPLPSQPSICSGEVCVPSLVFNVLFGIIILAAVGLFLIRRKRALARSDDGIENPLFEARRGPIIRRSERMPLLSQRDLNPGSGIPNFLARPSNSVLPSTSTQETSF